MDKSALFPDKPLTSAAMWSALLKAFLATAGVGAVAGAGTSAARTLIHKADKPHEPEPDIDIELPAPEEAESLSKPVKAEVLSVKTNRPTKAADTPSYSGFSFKMPLAIGGGGIGGFLLGQELYRRAVNNKLEQDVSEARKKFREAVLKIQLAGREGVKTDPFAPYVSKSGPAGALSSPDYQKSAIWPLRSDTGSPNILEGIGAASMLYAGTTFPLAWLLSKRFHDKQDVERKRMERAELVSQDRLGGTVPFAQLNFAPGEVSPEEASDLRQWLAENNPKALKKNTPKALPPANPVRAGIQAQVGDRRL